MTETPEIGERITIIEKRGYWRRAHWVAEGDQIGWRAKKGEPSLPATFLPSGTRDRDGYRVYRSEGQVSPDGVRPSDFLPPPAPLE